MTTSLPGLLIPQIKREILDALDDRGPCDRQTLTRIVATNRGVSRYCTCCAGTHTRYDRLIQYTVTATEQLERSGRITWNRRRSVWERT